MKDYFWEYKVKRKNEKNRRDLPKSRTSKTFKSKEEALTYAKEKKANWLQASLYEFIEGRGYVQIAGIGISGNYSEKFF